MSNILINPSQERHILDFRLLGFRDVQVLGRYVYTKAMAPLAIHDHGEMMEICYLADGRQFYRIGDEEYFLNGGDVLVNYPHERHGTGFQREGRGTLYWMIIKPPALRGSFLGLTLRESHWLWTHLNHLPKRHFRVRPETRKILDKVFLLMEGKIPVRIRQEESDEKYRTKLSSGDFNSPSSSREDPLLGMNVRNYLLRFLLDLIDAVKTETIPAVSREIRLAIELVKQNAALFYSMRALAREVGLSESRFKHRFKEEVGISPADYQLRHKIDLACQLLRQGETIIDISCHLGFSSSQYFATVFRRYRGVTPAEYRVSGESSGTS
ncbi:MAG: AraC family transcriptional regulator [Planctomycetaceae bacterium]|nr:AraC family transcriptional regulator [Planctomycetaceae bacterium]